MSEKVTANGFTTVLPEGWLDRSIVSLINPIATSGFASNIVVLREEADSTLDLKAYARQQLVRIESGLTDFQLLDERPTIIQNLPAYQTLQHFVANGRRLQQAQTFVLYNNIVFAFTCTATLEEFDRAIPAFREIMDNLSFVNNS